MEGLVGMVPRKMSRLAYHDFILARGFSLRATFFLFLQCGSSFFHLSLSVHWDSFIGLQQSRQICC